MNENLNRLSGNVFMSGAWYHLPPERFSQLSLYRLRDELEEAIYGPPTDPWNVFETREEMEKVVLDFMALHAIYVGEERA